MSFAIKLLKFLSGCIGTIFLFISIFLLITSLIALSLLSNLNNLDKSIKLGTDKFIEEHKKEIISVLIENQGQNFITGNFARDSEYYNKDIREIPIDSDKSVNLWSGMNINKTEAIFACKNKDVIIKENPEIAQFLTTEVCNNIESKSEQQIKEDVIGIVIDKYADEVINKNIDTSEIITNIKSDISPIINNYSFIFFTFTFLFFILGLFFTFGAAGFELKKGVYKNCLKLGIITTLATIPFIFIYLLLPSLIASIIQPYLPSFDLPLQFSEIIIQLVAQIALTWIHSALLPVFVSTTITAVTFIILTIIIKIKVINNIKK